MKKLILTTMALSAILFTACDDNDDATTPQTTDSADDSNNPTVVTTQTIEFDESLDKISTDLTLEDFKAIPVKKLKTLTEEAQGEGEISTYTYNQEGLLESIAEKTYDVNSNGERSNITDGDETKLFYNANNQLIRTETTFVFNFDNEIEKSLEVFTYEYDVNGVLIKRDLTFEGESGGLENETIAKKTNSGNLELEISDLSIREASIDTDPETGKQFLIERRENEITTNYIYNKFGNLTEVKNKSFEKTQQKLQEDLVSIFNYTQRVKNPFAATTTNPLEPETVLFNWESKTDGIGNIDDFSTPIDNEIMIGKITNRDVYLTGEIDEDGYLVKANYNSVRKSGDERSLIINYSTTYEYYED